MIEGPVKKAGPLPPAEGTGSFQQVGRPAVGLVQTPGGWPPGGVPHNPITGSGSGGRAGWVCAGWGPVPESDLERGTRALKSLTYRVVRHEVIGPQSIEGPYTWPDRGAPSAGWAGLLSTAWDPKGGVPLGWLSDPLPGSVPRGASGGGGCASSVSPQPAV